MEKGEARIDPLTRSQQRGLLLLLTLLVVYVVIRVL